MMQAPPLYIEKLTKVYGGFCAVDDLSLAIESGQIYGLLGPNGAGKTSTISMINTLEKPTAGTVKIFGYDVVRDARKVKYLTGCVPQELVHHSFFSLEEILVNHSGYYGLLNNKKHIQHLIERLGLTPHKHKLVKLLSGGMKRRVLIAKALLHKPKLVLLDEPTAGVDIELRESLWEFVKELREEEGVTFLITTHYIEEAEALCDQVGIINKGKIVANDKTSSLINQYSKREITIDLKQAPEDFSHPHLKSIQDTSLTFVVPPTIQIGELLESLPFSLCAIRDLTIHEGSLEMALRTVLGEQHGL